MNTTNDIVPIKIVSNFNKLINFFKKVTNCKWSIATIWQIMLSLTNVTITAQITESLVKEKIDKTANPEVISLMKLFSDT